MTPMRKELTGNAPLAVQTHTLANGLQIFMSVNKDAPRIHTNIVVRAGSKQDPSDTTGLAHYMEHMLFKGTSKIGALDWPQEEKLLREISNLYEAYRNTTVPEERAKIYQSIDQYSFEAAKLVAPNEYDTLSSAIGSKYTNAYTWVDQTVFINNIPSNELGRWLQLEAERFKMMALRLFHTELETVYEEFNISQDRDQRKSYNALRKALFPNHPYGTQTTLGSANHLKNPSQEKIQQYFRTYYVPNNMGIIIAGDFEPDVAIQLVEQYFGSYQAQPIPNFHFSEQPSFDAPKRQSVFGKKTPFIDIGWRLDHPSDEQRFYLELIHGILYNQQAGLIDLNLIQPQLLLDADSWSWSYQDYSVFGLYGKPRINQSLEEVETLLLKQIQLLKTGAFSDWLINAVIKDLEIADIKAYESNHGRVEALTQAFILQSDWEQFTNRFQWMRNLNKQDIMQFATQYFNNNYVAIYKHQGEDTGVVKVDKPPITPVELNRGKVSEFGKTFLAQATKPLAPKFLSYKELIQTTQLHPGQDLSYLKNGQNQLFRLELTFEMGKNSDRELAIALLYWLYLGAGPYSAEALQNRFFQLGLHMDAYFNDHRIFITLSGVDEHFEKGLAQLVQCMQSPIPAQERLDNLIGDILKKRENAKKDKNIIFQDALAQYARYGNTSSFTYRLPLQALKQLDAKVLTRKIQQLLQFEHQLFYYGPRSFNEVYEVFLRNYYFPDQSLPPLAPKVFQQLPTPQNQVLFYHFPMVQTEISLVSKGTSGYALDESIMASWYNEYFGVGLSSIVFQEIRESKGLAYSSYVYYSSPKRKKLAHYLSAFVGTQPDKLATAIGALQSIIYDMPLHPGQIDHARQAILKRIESERITKTNIYKSYQALVDIGYKEDIRKIKYQTLKEAEIPSLEQFQKEKVKDRCFKYVVMGDQAAIDFDFLNSIGPVEILSPLQVFGY